MEFNTSALEELVKKMEKPSVIIFCPPSIVDNLKERWDRNVADAEFKPCPFIDEDKIYVIPVEELIKPIKIVIPEEQQELEKYLELRFGK